MNMRYLRAFYWVSKLGTYSAAAEQLGVTEPSVCRAVQSLQRISRVQLLIREKGRLRLTQAGSLFYSYAEKISALEGLADELLAEVVTPSFVFGTSHLFSGPIVRAFAMWKMERQYLRVGLVVAPSSELYTKLLRGELAFAFATTRHLPPGLCSPGVGFPDEVRFIANSCDPLSARRLVSLGELAAHQFVSTPPGTVTYRLIMEAGEKAGIHFNIGVTVSNTQLVIDLVAAGAGIGLVSKASAAQAIRERKISFLPVNTMPQSIPFGLVTREGVVLSEEADSLMQHLQSSLSTAI